MQGFLEGVGLGLLLLLGVAVVGVLRVIFVRKWLKQQPSIDVPAEAATIKVLRKTNLLLKVEQIPDNWQIGQLLLANTGTLMEVVYIDHESKELGIQPLGKLP